MSRRKKRYHRGNPVKKRQEQSVKSYGPFLTYVRSLMFIKNALAGCFFTGITAVTFIQDRSPGWYFIPLLLIVFLFPFAKVAIERVGLSIALARFWQKYHTLNTRTQSSVTLLYWLLITLLVVPLATVYCIQLYADNASGRPKHQR